jgi:phage tail sheath protein FI
MPVTPTYPGVYVQEIPSGVRTIAGVPTSITAFVGRALRGDVDTPVRITSWGDFQRKFGGLWVESPLSYAVQQFYGSGGTDAIIVRVAGTGAAAAARTVTVNQHLRFEALAAGTAGNDIDVTLTHHATDATLFTVGVTNGTISESYPDVTTASLSAAMSASALVSVLSVPDARPAAITAAAGGLTGGTTTAKAKLSITQAVSGTHEILAASPGTWGNQLRATVDFDTADPTDPNLFNLTITEVDDEGEEVRSETFRNVTLQSTASRYLGTILEQQSALAALDLATTLVQPGTIAAITDAALTGGADGSAISDTEIQGSEASKTGLYALEDADLVNLICIPPRAFGADVGTAVWDAALTYAEGRRALVIVDAPSSWADVAGAVTGMGTLGLASNNGAIYFPRVKIADPLRENRLGEFAPCGVVAGTFARTDAERGVWKAPAGLDARVRSVRGLSVPLSDKEQGQLNPLGLNVVRTFPVVGNVVWGARTLVGDDRLASEWKYVPVRRTALYIEESLYRGLQWVVFEPNDEPLWAQIRLNVGAFMQGLFRQGAFAGKTPREAFLVKCDSETTTQDDVNRGIVNILVGFAPLKPAEFVILQLQQLAGQAGA